MTRILRTELNNRIKMSKKGLDLCLGDGKVSPRLIQVIVGGERVVAPGLQFNELSVQPWQPLHIFQTHTAPCHGWCPPAFLLSLGLKNFCALVCQLIPWEIASYILSMYEISAIFDLWSQYLQNTFARFPSHIQGNLNAYIPRLCRWSSNESMHKYLRSGYDQPNP